MVKAENSRLSMTLECHLVPSSQSETNEIEKMKINKEFMNLVKLRNLDFGVDFAS